MGRSDTDDRGGLALFYRKVKQRGDVARYAGNRFGEVLKEVSMRLGGFDHSVDCHTEGMVWLSPDRTRECRIETGTV